MTICEQTLSGLRAEPRKWLVTGAAGFIGSHLAETLLAANQTVVGFDNLATGKAANVAFLASLGGQRWTLIDGDLRSATALREGCRGVDCILHHAAQISVPASMTDPQTTHDINTTGFLNLLEAARAAKVRRVVYASSSAVYGDSTSLPLQEGLPPRPLSPYAASKLANEIYAATFSRAYGLETVGLRYFNVFGPRQDPSGAYAAVIPLWAAAMMQGKPIQIFGDGSTTRDFCYVANVVQANLLAATAGLDDCRHEVVNIAAGGRTSLLELFEMLRANLLPDYPHLKVFQPVFREFRPGDIRHSHADISRAGTRLGYTPTHTVAAGLQETLAWYRNTPPR